MDICRPSQSWNMPWLMIDRAMVYQKSMVARCTLIVTVDLGGAERVGFNEWIKLEHILVDN